MNRFLRFGLSVIGLALVLNVFAVTETKAQQILNEVVNRMDNNYKSLTSLRSNLKMVKYNSQLQVSDTTEGTVIFLPKSATPKKIMYARIDWTSPLEESIAIIGDSYKIYRPKRRIAYVGKTSSAQKGNKVPGNALAFLSMSKTQLKENFILDYIAQESITGGTLTWHIRLTPKTATSYKVVDLWVDKDGMPAQATVTENNSDTSTILLSGIQKNVTIKGSDFVLAIPKDVKPIQA